MADQDTTNTSDDDVDYEKERAKRREKRRRKASGVGNFVTGQFKGMDGSIFWGLKQIAAFIMLVVTAVNHQIGQLSSALNTRGDDTDDDTTNDSGSTSRNDTTR